MAVTINSTPLDWSISGNPLEYTFTSDQTAQANFSYVVETLLNGTKVREERIFPEVTGGKAHIDISETIDALLGTPKISTDLYSDSGTTNLISIKVTEYYGSTPTAQANATSSQTNVFKGCVSDELFPIDFDNDYKLTKWLTNHPTNNFEVLRTQDAIFSMITDGSCSLVVTLYDSSGSTIDTDTFAIDNQITQLNLSKTALVAEGFASGDIDSAAYITARINTSDILTITYVDTDCINANSLLWANDFGAFDTFCFTHNNIEKGNVESKEFGRQFGAWDGNTRVFNSLNSGTLNYSTKRTNTGTLVSGYMSQSIHSWLMELYDSPFVVIYDESGNTKSINLTSRSWEKKQDLYEDLIMEEVQYKLSNVKRSIRL